jgi:hypothetical protein
LTKRFVRIHVLNFSNAKAMAHLSRDVLNFCSTLVLGIELVLFLYIHCEMRRI